MGTRQLLIEKILKPEEFYFFMYSVSGTRYFRNNTEISEAEYLGAENNTKPKKEMPLFLTADVKRQYNLKTFNDVNN